MIRIKLFYKDYKKRDKISYQFHVINKHMFVDTAEVSTGDSDLVHLEEIRKVIDRLIENVREIENSKNK